MRMKSVEITKKERKIEKKEKNILFPDNNEAQSSDELNTYLITIPTPVLHNAKTPQGDQNFCPSIFFF